MEKQTKTLSFLKDVLICSLGAYGGPEAHYGVFLDQMVSKKRYITEEELAELMALTSFLPGPSSTQTLVSIGLKVGGRKLGALTMLVWGLPIVLFMIFLSFMYNVLNTLNISDNFLRFIGPMAVGFIFLAGFKLSKKVVQDSVNTILLIISFATSLFFRNIFIFPLLLLIGGLIKVLLSKETNLWTKTKLNPPYKIFMLFLGVAGLSFLLSLWINHPIVYLFQLFYRFGYLVIGGGQVVIPYMYETLVHDNQFLTSEQFLTGFGLVQGLPGPMFSFSAYVGGLSASSETVLVQILAGFVSAVGIFLPGILLIYFVYPIWESLKNIKGIRIAMSGVSSIAGGLILSAGVKLFIDSGITIINLIVVALTIGLLLTKKIPAPFIVLLALGLGLIL
ncbi:MAG: chromate efflux transporter [Candidatus Izemoplasmataceae bacterium]